MYIPVSLTEHPVDFQQSYNVLHFRGDHTSAQFETKDAALSNELSTIYWYIFQGFAKIQYYNKLKNCWVVASVTRLSRKNYQTLRHAGRGPGGRNSEF